MCKNVALEAGPLAGLQKLIRDERRTTYMEAYQFHAATRSQSDLRCHLPRAAGHNCL